MPLYKGYVPTKDKKCLMPFKGVGADELLTLEQVQNLPEYAGILDDETISVDVDDFEQSITLLQIVQELGLKCRVYATTRGKHFLFKNPDGLVKSNSTKAILAVGLQADIKLGSRNSYQVLKFHDQDRPILYDTSESEIQPLPKWLIPLKTNIDFRTLGDGDGRNQALFNYILTLQNYDLTKEEARETIRLINRYILKEPLADRELDGEDCLNADKVEVLVIADGEQKVFYFGSPQNDEHPDKYTKLAITMITNRVMKQTGLPTIFTIYDNPDEVVNQAREKLNEVH